MRVPTRQEILRIWSATVEYSYRESRWHWGGREPSSSISDAEQLLTIVYPASLIPSLRVDRPDRYSAEDIVTALGGLGGRFDIVQGLLEAMVEYHERYRDPSGVPVFSGGSYFTPAEGDGKPPSLSQEGLDVVDSMSMSLTLSLAAVGMARTVRLSSGNPRTITTCERLESLASARLTAAMVGLLRSFSVRTFDVGSPEARRLGRVVNQTSQSDRVVLEAAYARLEELRSSLRRELTLGTGQVAGELEDPSRLFDCGWSWGVIRGAPEVQVGVDVGDRPDCAVDRPHIYFSVVALEGILDLFSPRTRLLGLLDAEQQRLAAALQLRWEWTQTLWSTLATWGEGRWPLEDMPWMTPDGDQSEYYTLFVTTLIMAGSPRLLGSRAPRERLAGVMEELANRGRITRRSTPSDGHLTLHAPGLRIPLDGSDLDDGPQLEWVVSSYSTLLLKQTFDLAALSDTVPARRRLLRLADDIWDHLRQRQLRDAQGARLWDQPTGVFDGITERYQEPSWHYTERVVEALVKSAELIDSDPVPNPELGRLAEGLITEAEHLLDQFRLSGLTDTGQMPAMLSAAIASLERSRDIVSRRPGSAYVLATEALRQLDEVAAASDPGT